MHIYLDNGATTALDPLARKAMTDWLEEPAGNASSIHFAGRPSKHKIEDTRTHLSEILNCQPKEITFTSGGTESNNMALIGAALANKDRGNHIIISAMEHPSVLQSAKYIEQKGFRVDYVKPDTSGLITAEDIEPLISTETILVSVMFINNETGVIQPVEEIAQLCRDRNVLFHCDAVQAFGKVPLNMQDLKADLIAISAHKTHGPSAVGALFVRGGTALSAIHFGGGQEANRRPGTENVVGIVGFNAVLETLNQHLMTVEQVDELQILFEDLLQQEIPDCQIIAVDAPRSPFISQIAFPGISNDTLLMALDMEGIAASVGSACSSGSINRSHVLEAMDLPDKIIDSALRFSFSRYTSKDEVEQAANKIIKVVSRLEN